MSTVDPLEAPWCEDPGTLDDVYQTLRMDATDLDANLVEDAYHAACALITWYLDRPEDQPLPSPAPEPLRRAHVIATCELYRRKDAPFGVLNSWAADDLVLRIGTDWLRAVEPILRPYKRGWGIG